MSEMMKLHTIKPSEGSTHYRKRIGRGPGSGMGKTATRGHKGQKARSGPKRLHFREGGQNPIIRRIPKYGFTNIFRVEFQVVNIEEFAKLPVGEVTAELLKSARLIRSAKQPLKVLGNGELKGAYKVKAQAFSKSAEEKIKQAGGSTEVVK